MLRTCVDYLMLDDFNWTETIPDGKMSQVHRKMWQAHQKKWEWKVLPSPPRNDESDDESQLIAGVEDERGSVFSGNSLTEPPLSPNTDPFGAFFEYAACYWKVHLGSAPVDFNSDDVLELAGPTSTRRQAWALRSGWTPYQAWYPWVAPRETNTTLCFLVEFGNVSMLNQLLDRLAQNGDGDRSAIIVAAAETAIHHMNPGHFRALMDHRNTAMAIRTAEMLDTLLQRLTIMASDDDRRKWTGLVRGLFDTLASDAIPLPNYLLERACFARCMPLIQKIFERAKSYPAFQEQLMQPTNDMGPLGAVAEGGDFATLRYLCQQDGIKAHASNRDRSGSNILAYCCENPKIEIIELLLDNFPWLVSQRGGGDVGLITIVGCDGERTSDSVKTVKLLLKHAQTTPGLVDVDELLALAARAGWPEMCRMLIIEGHADPQSVVQMSSSGRLELQEHCLRDRPDEQFREPDEKVLGALTAWREL